MSPMNSLKKISLLGTGISGDVWACLDSDGRIIAAKFFKQAREVAENEFMTGKSLSHPNILQPIDFFMLEGRPVMTMPFVEGRSVDNLSGFVSERTAWQLILDISSAMVYLYGKGLCHGDVKPSNILWDGKSFLLGDWGACCKLGGKVHEADLSSFQYCAPERNKTEKSDIWSLGASAFFLVMGTPVFGGMGGKAQKKDSDVPLMRKTLPELSECVKSCLAYCPEERPSAEDLAAIARKQIKRCESDVPIRPLKPSTQPSASDPYADFWPEAMIDTL